MSLYSGITTAILSNAIVIVSPLHSYVLSLATQSQDPLLSMFLCVLCGERFCT